MNRNRFIIDLPAASADELRANAEREHLTPTAHIRRVLLLDNDRRREQQRSEQSKSGDAS